MCAWLFVYKAIKRIRAYSSKIVDEPQGGYSGINVMGGGVQRSLIFCTQKNTWNFYCAPKKLQDNIIFKSCFRIMRELWLELRIAVKSSTPPPPPPKKKKNTGVENFRPKKNTSDPSTLRHVYTRVSRDEQRLIMIIYKYSLMLFMCISKGF